MVDKIVLEEAQNLRVTAYRYKMKGETLKAMMFDNQAWELEHGMTWLEFNRKDKK
jgi:hypothetical protein